MHYSAEALVTLDHTEDDPLVLPIHMSTGTLTNVTIIFPPGCSRQVRLRIWHGVEQILPIIPETSYGEDHERLDIPEHIEFGTGDNTFYIEAWQASCNFSHQVNVMFTVKGIDELDLATALTRLSDVIVMLYERIRAIW